MNAPDAQLDNLNQYYLRGRLQSLAGENEGVSIASETTYTTVLLIDARFVTRIGISLKNMSGTIDSTVRVIGTLRQWADDAPYYDSDTQNDSSWITESDGWIYGPTNIAAGDTSFPIFVTAPYSWILVQARKTSAGATNGLVNGYYRAIAESYR